MSRGVAGAVDNLHHNPFCRHRRTPALRSTTVLGAVLLILLSMVAPALARANVALIMGGTGNPGPDNSYVAAVDNHYIQPLFPGFHAAAQFTPEQGFPLTPTLGNLTFDQSVAVGVTALDAAIREHLAAGDDVVVFGYSQSATVATNETRRLAAAGSPNPEQLSFVLVGNPNNPNGGLFARFPGLYIPIFDETFNGATPSDTSYRTDIYTVQYDGYADAPQYPLNLIADLNALFGAFQQHFVPAFTAQIDGTIPAGTYPVLPAPGIAVQLPTSPGYYENGGKTRYYKILTQNLPLLEPLRLIPVVGTPLAELVQPALRVIVDLGYGGGYADVPTAAGLLPRVDVGTVVSDLVTGVRQGITAALVATGTLPKSKLPEGYPFRPSVRSPAIVTDVDQIEAGTTVATAAGAEAPESGSAKSRRDATRPSAAQRHRLPSDGRASVSTLQRLSDSQPGASQDRQVHRKADHARHSATRNNEARTHNPDSGARRAGPRSGAATAG